MTWAATAAAAPHPAAPRQRRPPGEQRQRGEEGDEPEVPRHPAEQERIGTDEAEADHGRPPRRRAPGPPAATAARARPTRRRRRGRPAADSTRADVRVSGRRPGTTCGARRSTVGRVQIVVDGRVARREAKAEVLVGPDPRAAPRSPNQSNADDDEAGTADDPSSPMRHAASPGPCRDRGRAAGGPATPRHGVGQGDVDEVLDHQAVAGGEAEPRDRHAGAAGPALDVGEVLGGDAERRPGRTTRRTARRGRGRAPPWKPTPRARPPSRRAPRRGRPRPRRGRRRRAVGDEVAHERRRPRRRRRGRRAAACRAGRGRGRRRAVTRRGRPCAGGRARRGGAPSTSRTPGGRRRSRSTMPSTPTTGVGSMSRPAALVVEADVAADDRDAEGAAGARPCRRSPPTAATSPRGARGCRS